MTTILDALGCLNDNEFVMPNIVEGATVDNEIIATLQDKCVMRVWFHQRDRRVYIVGVATHAGRAWENVIAKLQVRVMIRIEVEKIGKGYSSKYGHE